MRQCRAKLEGGRRGDIRHEAIEAKNLVEACGYLKPRELAAAILLANVSNLYLATTTDLPVTKNSPPPLEQGEAEELARKTHDAVKRYAAFLPEREAAVLLEDCKAAPDAAPASEEDDGGDVMASQNEYVALFPLLANYWDKPLSELPEALQARVNTWIVGWGWGELSPEERKEYARQIDCKSDPANAGEMQADWDLAGELDNTKKEIEKWESAKHQQIPTEMKTQDEELGKLLIKLADIERRLKLPPAYMQATEQGAIEESTAAAKTEVGIDITPAPAAKRAAGTGINLSVDDDMQMNMTNLVYWRTVLYLNIKIIDTPKRASVRKVIKYLRGLNDKRIPDKGTCDELFWIDDYGNELNVIKKTVSTASSFARNLP